MVRAPLRESDQLRPPSMLPLPKASDSAAPQTVQVSPSPVCSPFVLRFSAGARLPVLLCVVLPAAAEIADVIGKGHFAFNAAVTADSLPFLRRSFKARFVDYRAAKRGLADVL